MSKPSPKRPLYHPLDFAVVRAPLLPVEAYLALQSEEDQLTLLKDPRVLRALAAASPSLSNALTRWRQASMTKKDADRLASKLLMYQIRMSTRPTPFGLFAGCATVNWAEDTDLYLQSTFGHTHTRPDFAWLMERVLEAEAAPEVRRQLRYISNPLIRSQGDRIVLSEPTPPDISDRPVSLRATKVVKLAIKLARDGITAEDLTARLAESYPAATPEKMERLFTQLWEQHILLTDLRPPLTTASPANYVLDKLKNILEGADVSKKLGSLVNAAAQWDRAPHEQSLNEFRLLLDSCACPEDGSKELPIQVDMALSVSGQINRTIGRRAALAAETLLRLSPMPRGLSNLAAFRNIFITRYGHEREVPLPELMDPVFGLGPMSAHGVASVGPDFNKAALRSRELLRLASTALHKREKVVQLDETLLERLETWTPDSSLAPLSLDLNVLIAAKSAAAIDVDEFDLIVGPNLGAWSAGRTFGRFAYLDSSGRNLLEQAIRSEEARSEPDHIWAEVVYLPSKMRSANVAIRPPLRAYEVAFGVSPGVVQEFVLHPDDLVVGVDDNRFYVRWLPGDKRVNFASGHMLNHLGAPAMAQFLLQVGHDGKTPLIAFDWGPAEGFPFLPRVQVNRIVLRPAEWRLPKTTEVPQDAAALKEWCTEWDVPRSVCLTFGDNRLILNLDLADQARILLTEWKRLLENQSLLLQEVLPSLDKAWLKSEEGSYYSEFTIPLLLQESAISQRPAASPPRAASTPIWQSRREFQPGTEWLYIKLYGPPDRQDELITESLLSFSRNAFSAGLIDSWFFIRYADPEEHVRVRFHGDPEQLCEHLFGHLSRWASELIDRGVCRRFAFDSYDSEIERFGGPEGMSSSEQMFHVDSEASAELTAILNAREWQDPERRTLLLAHSVHDLIGAFVLGENEILDWYKRHSTESRELSEEYRKLKSRLRLALSDLSGWLAAQPMGDQIEALLSRRRRQLAPLLIQLRDLETTSTLSRSIEQLCAPYVHLHLNRLGATSSEGKILNFLRRTNESLAKAPVKPSTS